MGSAANMFYNDPSIGQGFSNLASLFAAPSGTDLAGYADAKATREKAARLAELYINSQNPAFDRDTLDREAAVVGAYAPTQSWRALDMGDATTRRGQDVTARTAITNNQADNARAITERQMIDAVLSANNAADNTRALQQTQIGDTTTRRGQDITAATSTANNAADNARATNTNAADNVRALQQTQLTNDKDVTVSMLAPVGQDATRYVPPALATKYSVPEQEMGIISAKPGETLTLPDKRIINGQPIPLTDEQVKGAILQKQPANDQRVAALGNTPVETVIDPVTKQPTIQWRANSVGQQAYEKGTDPSELAKLINERDALPPNDPRRKAYDDRIAALGRGQQQSQYDKTNDEAQAKLNNDIAARAGQSIGDVNMLSTLQTAINDPTVDQGSLGQATLTLRKYLNAFGVPAGNTSPAEMVNALGNVLALRLRDPSNGAGMPGALSDSDRQFLQSMTVALGNSPDANKKIVSYYLQLQQKNIDIEAAREQYVTQHGRIDDGFYPVQTAIQRKYGLPDNAGAPADQGQQPANATQTSQQPAGVEVWDFVNGKLQRVK